MNTLATSLYVLGISEKSPYKDGRNYRLRYGKADDIGKIYDLFYKDANIFLERKKAKIEKILEYVKNSQGCKGSNHGNVKITENDVRNIRIMYASKKYTQKEIGHQFGINNRNVSMIVNYKAWKHVH